MKIPLSLKRLLCEVFNIHKSESHLDYIYGSLPREHAICIRCGKTTKFEKPTEEKEAQLLLVNCF